MDKETVKLSQLYWQLLKSAKIPAYHMALAIILIGSASIFQLLGLGLIVPVLNSLVDETSFRGIRTAPVLGQIIQRLPFESNNTNIFVFMILLTFTAVLFENMALFAGKSITAKISGLLTSRTRIALFDKMLRLSRVHFDQQSLAETNSLLVSFINSLASTTNYITLFIIQLCFASIYLILMFAISWELTLCSAILLPISYFISVTVAKKIKKSSQKEMNEVINISNQTDDVFRNISLVQLENQEDFELKNFANSAEQAAIHGTRVRVRSFILPATIDVINALGALLIVSVSVYIFLTFGSLSLGRLLVFFLSLRRFTSTVQQLNSIWACSSAETPFVKAIFSALNDPQPTIINGKKECPPLEQQVSFKNVSFHYNINNPTIQNICFDIPANKILALVGPTGSGKSTLAHLLARFYDPHSGQILYDQTDIKDFNLKSYRKQIGIVSQKEMLFNSSIRYNICYGLSDFQEKDYKKAIEQAQLEEFLKNLPEGDQTIIGSSGSRLSGGERQRLSIARALLKNPPLLILDEPTSALDPLTEDKLDKALEYILKNRTVIIIAHRLATVKKADKIIFIDNGQVVESGSYAELVEQNGRFTEYCRLQKLI